MAVLSLIAAVCLSGGPQEPKNFDVENLRNLKGVSVLVESIECDDITEDDVKTEVELTLRQYGIPVDFKYNDPDMIELFTPSKLPNKPLAGIVPILYINIKPLVSSSVNGTMTGYACRIDVDLRWFQKPRNNPAGLAYLVLWSQRSVITSDKAGFKEYCLSTLNSHIKKFTNDWLAAHPKK